MSVESISRPDAFGPKGGLNDYPAGMFLHPAKGSRNIPQSTTDCPIFVCYPHG